MRTRGMSVKVTGAMRDNSGGALAADHGEAAIPASRPCTARRVRAAVRQGGADTRVRSSASSRKTPAAFASSMIFFSSTTIPSSTRRTGA